MNIKKILLVEDNPNDAELTIEAFGDYNLSNSITHVEDGEEALDYLYQRGRYSDLSPDNPVLILLDLKLPKIDGIELLRIIKADDRLRLIPVVALTSSRESSDLQECYKLGVNAYVVKPVDFLEFVDAARDIGAFWVIHNETTT